MPRGRPPLAEKGIPVKIYLPESIYTKLQLEAWNPLLSKPEYGRITGIIVSSLKDYFTRRNNVPSSVLERASMDDRSPQTNETSGPTGDSYLSLDESQEKSGSHMEGGK